MRLLSGCVLASVALLARSSALDAQETVRATPPFGTAEQVVSRFEVGVQYTNRGLYPYRLPEGTYASPPGRALGPAVTVNLSRNVAIDAMLSQTPQSQNTALKLLDGSVAGGHSLELLAGPRLSVRGGRLAVFLAARAGFLNWSRVLQDESFSMPGPGGQTVTLRYGAGYYPVIEAAAGMEYALTPRVHLRGDIGDQFTHYHDQTVEIPGQIIPQGTSWPPNGTAFLRAGVFLGVGHSASKPLAPYEYTPSHRFFDKTNVALLVVSALGQTSDYVYTELALHRSGGQETNGLARPFLNQGWAGVVPIAVIVNGVQLGFMYGLHKIGHHRLERLPPLFVAAGAGHGGYVSAKNY